MSSRQTACTYEKKEMNEMMTSCNNISRQTK